MSDEAPKEKRTKLDLQMDRETGRGLYANATVVSNGPNEIVLDFVAALPHQKPQVVSRVVLPPRQAKALVRTLARNLERWEDRNGRLPEPAAAGAGRADGRNEDDEPN